MAHFRFRVNSSLCFNCGVCMDVCPFDALDMTRPKFLGPESRFDRHAAQPQPWMMAFPRQVARCTGCRICVLECPVGAAIVEQVEEEPRLGQRGLTYREPEEHDGWIPLSELTRAAARDDKGRDPWPRSVRRWKTIQHQKRIARRLTFQP